MCEIHLEQQYDEGINFLMRKMWKIVTLNPRSKGKMVNENNLWMIIDILS